MGIFRQEAIARMDGISLVLFCGRYDIVYADPPFPMDGKVNLLKNVASHHIVKPGGLFIIHYPVEEEKEWPEIMDGFSLCDKRKYGRSMIRMYKAEEKC